MSDADQAPVVYLKQGCPFCMKVEIFLLESGLLPTVAVRTFAQGSDDEQAIRDELAPLLEKVSFPAARFGDGDVLADSDEIIAHLGAAAQIDPAGLQTLANYINGPFSGLMRLYQENMDLKKAAAG